MLNESQYSNDRHAVRKKYHERIYNILATNLPKKYAQFMLLHFSTDSSDHDWGKNKKMDPPREVSNGLPSERTIRTLHVVVGVAGLQLWVHLRSRWRQMETCVQVGSHNYQQFYRRRYCCFWNDVSQYTSLN